MRQQEVSEMRVSLIAAMTLAGLLAACADTTVSMQGPGQTSGHFGPGMTADRTAGR